MIPLNFSWSCYVVLWVDRIHTDLGSCPLGTMVEEGHGYAFSCSSWLWGTSSQLRICKYLMFVVSWFLSLGFRVVSMLWRFCSSYRLKVDKLLDHIFESLSCCCIYSSEFLRSCSWNFLFFLAVILPVASDKHSIGEHPIFTGIGQLFSQRFCFTGVVLITNKVCVAFAWRLHSKPPITRSPTHMDHEF